MSVTARWSGDQPASPLDDPSLARWLEPDPHDSGHVWLKDYGVSVWALARSFRDVATQDGPALDAAVADAARGYEVPEEAVRAAVAYYRRYPLHIDAKLDAQDAAFHDVAAGTSGWVRM